MLEEDAEARARVEAYGKIREGIQATRLKEPDVSGWDDFETPSGQSGWRALGLVLVIGAYLAGAGLGLAELFTGDEPLSVKLLVGALVAGFGILLGSVIGQRMIERKTDRYTRVEK